MTTKAQEILNQALQLGPDERAELASQLLSSLEDEESYADLHPSWSAEIKRRLDELESGAVKAIPWEEARAIIRDRVSRPG